MTREEAVARIKDHIEIHKYHEQNAIKIFEALDMAIKAPEEPTRTFVELVVEYPDPELCTYKEYKGKPYYSIKYIENGETHIGYGTYKPEVLSQFLKEYFISSAQPDVPDTNVGDTISRQAAIDLVRDVCNAVMSGCNSHYDSEVGDEVYDDILEVNAILTCNKEVRKALKGMPSAQQDCTECEEYDHERHYCPKFCDVIRKTADELQVEASCKLPERKTGRWIDAVIPNDNGGLPVQVCDQCNTFFPLAYTGGGHRYCPNCGAYMGGEQDETD